MPYAGFLLRFVAALIDGIVLSFINTIPRLLIPLPTAVDQSSLPPDYFTKVSLLSILSIVIAWLYYAIQESSARQATLGKMIVKIAVTDMDGNRISFAKATVRYFSKILSGLILLIGYIMAAFTEKKQALHDIIAKTLVVKR